MCARYEENFKDGSLTKREIFNAIYVAHIAGYREKWKAITEGADKSEHYQVIYYPIDLVVVADRLGTTAEILHQILYYYDSVYTEDKKHFFTFIEASGWSINFPLLCVKLGELKEHFDYEQSLRMSAKASAIAGWLAIGVAVVSVTLSFVAIMVSLLVALIK